MVISTLLLKNGDTVETSISKKTNLDNFTCTSVFQSRGLGNIKKLNTWELFDDIYLIFGWENGDAGTENKHELPPPIDTLLYYGDILVLKVDHNGHLTNMTKKNYNSLIEHLNGGFIDLTDSESDNNSLNSEISYESDSSYSPYSSEPSDSSQLSDSSELSEDNLKTELSLDSTHSNDTLNKDIWGKQADYNLSEYDSEQNKSDNDSWDIINN